jgi:hypothetical protein
MKSATHHRDILNRLLAIEYRSLPMYLLWACPHRTAGDEQAWKTIQSIVDDQKAMSTRIAELIADRSWRVDLGDFPITFTGSHDLDLDYLVRRLVDWQKGTVASIQECYTALADDPVAQAVADEALGEAKGHLESLEEIVARKNAPAPAVKLHEPTAAGH